MPFVLTKNSAKEQNLELILIDLMAKNHTNSYNTAAILVELLKSEDVYLRNTATEALLRIPDATSLYIEKCLADYRVEVRIFALAIMHSLSHANALDWILELLKHENNISVFLACIDILTEIGTEHIIPLMVGIQKRFPDEPALVAAINQLIQKLSFCSFVL